jgi:hypothetical protein
LELAFFLVLSTIDDDWLREVEHWVALPAVQGHVADAVPGSHLLATEINFADCYHLIAPVA